MTVVVHQNPGGGCICTHRLAIADPPYLGVAARFYGTEGDGYGRGRGPADQHPDAGEWDDPARHQQLVRDLDTQYDGWAIAARVATRWAYEQVFAELWGDDTSSLVRATWSRGNANSQSRIRRTTEDVYVWVPSGRRGWDGTRVPTHLECGVDTRAGFTGAKPEAWTHWVLDLLGTQPGDEVDDLFPGSGAVGAAVASYQRDRWSEDADPVLARLRRRLRAYRSADAGIRSLVIEALDAGISNREVASLSGLDVATVKRWRKAHAVRAA